MKANRMSIAALLGSAFIAFAGCTSPQPGMTVPPVTVVAPNATQAHALMCYAGAAVIQEANAAKQLHNYSPAQLDRAKADVQLIAAACAPGLTAPADPSAAIAGLVAIFGLQMPALPTLK